MPFDIGFWELTIIGVVALVIVGPERLPKLARTAGLWIGKARRMVSDVKRDIDRELKASELSELKEGLETARQEVTKAGQTIQQASDTEELKSSLQDAVQEATPVTQAIQSDLDEIDEIAQQMDKEIHAADPTAEAAPADFPSSDSRDDKASLERETAAPVEPQADPEPRAESSLR